GPPDTLIEGESEIAREFIRNSGVDVKGLSRVTDHARPSAGGQDETQRKTVGDQNETQPMQRETPRKTL
ncbi:MAG: hypothetical protein JWO86_8573, partial [Myxococcaceae bacterium]|nr:hypothetical protein [Myxococcaceae bacterium]